MYNKRKNFSSQISLLSDFLLLQTLINFNYDVIHRIKDGNFHFMKEHSVLVVYLIRASVSGILRFQLYIALDGSYVELGLA